MELNMLAEEKKPLVSIIIPTYKRREKLKNCLSSLMMSSYKNIEIIVINDYPEDNLEDDVKAYGAKYYQNNAERYLAKNRNAGALTSRGQILFFVDDDNIFEQNTISQLVKRYNETDNVGLLGPLMLNTEKKPWFWGARANWLKPFLSPQSTDFSDEEMIQTDAIPNAYMISRDLYFRMGGEDESLVFYNEEFDLAVRLKSCGYTNYIYTGSKIIHDYGSLFGHITPFRLYINIRGMLIVERRFANILQFIPFSIYITGYILFYLLYRIPYSMRIKRKRDYYSSLLKGVIEGMFTTSKILEKNLVRDGR